MANKVYYAPETAASFKSSAGDVVFTPQNIASGAGRKSAVWDRGSGSKPARYIWRVKTKCTSALAVGGALGVYLAMNEGATVDGNTASGDGAFSAIDKLRNLKYIGSVIADSTSAGEAQYASGIVTIYARYVQVVWWNALGQSLSNTAGDHEFILTPVPDEIQ